MKRRLSTVEVRYFDQDGLQTERAYNSLVQGCGPSTPLVELVSKLLGMLTMEETEQLAALPHDSDERRCKPKIVGNGL